MFLVIAKSDLAHKGLSEQLAEHSMKRVYNAIVYNSFSEESGTVDRNIDRSKMTEENGCCYAGW